MGILIQNKHFSPRCRKSLKALSTEFPELGIKANQDVPVLAKKIKEIVTLKL
ncbi:hypothetical protein PCC7424_2197 [Gloeothece citriformis PCC 7424]|uniref:Uncharacterized protein n=1 Tax=Gloeothece citriformis (strain PCC 7424) TaxID=65393 RepID=B7KGE8_GLOC7|nr:hypothetical protein [Gloeothece citriformis]ACK70619.1 hypothetical protein PCC7424_2197 [Gloeothece citriformis PCC 7424]